jgi:hypothetical protein
MKRPSPIKSHLLVIVTALIALGLSGTANAKDQFKLKSSLNSTGVEAGSSGSLKAVLKASKSKLQIKAKDLTPNAEYTVTVDGEVAASVTARSNGTLKAQFRTGRIPGLDFEVRGTTVAINNLGDDVLDAVVSGNGESADSRSDERAELSPTAAAPGASGDTRYRIKDGRHKFDVKAEGLTDGSYDLVVGSIVRGTIVVTLGKGEIEFDSEADDAGEILLDFDPRGETIDVVQAGTAFLTGDTTAEIDGVNTCTPSEIVAELTSTGADMYGSGDAELSVDDDCDRHFSVEIEDVDVGIYDVFVDAALVGQITVVDDGLTVEGEVEFSDNDDDAGELPLDFDPEGALIEVKQGATVFFSSTFDGTATAPTGACEVSETLVALLNTGAVAEASGDMRFREDSDCETDFSVEVEDVDLGDYDLRVGGVVRGVITVVLVDGENEGEIEYDSDPDQPGELLLSFDPRGQLVEVVDSGAVVVLSRDLP